MNKNIKKVVYDILENNAYARTDDWYLVQQVLMKMLNCNQGTAFGQVLQGMRYKGISFEAITRHRRKFMELHPQYRVVDIEKVRKDEEEKYYEEFMRHVPNLY